MEEWENIYHKFIEFSKIIAQIVLKRAQLCDIKNIISKNLRIIKRPTYMYCFVFVQCMKVDYLQKLLFIFKFIQK